MKQTAHVIGLMLVLTGCFGGNTKPDPTPDPDPEPQPDGIALDQRFAQNRQSSVQHFIVDAAAGGTVTGSQGTRVTFTPNALGLDGVPVEGDVDVELVEIYDRSSMLLTNRSTSGVRDNGDVEALKSAGQFFINATQDGTRLEILGPVMVESRSVDPLTVDPDMKLFKAGDALADNDNWEEVKEDPTGQGGVIIRDGADGVGYSYMIGEFGWTNLDRWYDFDGELTDLYVEVPEGYNGDNCAVFLTYDGEPTALASMDVWNEDLELFTEHYGRIPVGQQVHFILVTEIDGELHYTIQGATITAGHTQVMPEPLPGTQEELEAAINALP